MVSLPPLPSLDLKVTETVSPAGGGTRGDTHGCLGSLPGLPAPIDAVWGSPLRDGAARADCMATALLGRVTSPLAR